MYFNANFFVTINGNLLETVVACETHNDSQHIGSTCDLTVPQNARIQYETGEYLSAPIKNLFNTGDEIVIKASYGGGFFGKSYDVVTVFEGYVYDFLEGTPMKIKCLDAVYLLNQEPRTISYPDPVKKKPYKVKFKTLIEEIIEGTGIELIPIGSSFQDENGITVNNPIFDMELETISFKQMTPVAMLEWIKREMGINISLMGKKLYVNVAKFTVNTIKLDTRVNVIQSNLQTTNLKNLKKAVSGSKSKGSNSVYLNLKVKAWFIREDGIKDSVEVGDEHGQLREVFFYKVLPRTETHYKELANQALEKFKHGRYQGDVETLLYPFCDLFDRIEYTDFRYPEKNGVYVVTGITQSFSEKGFRRRLKLAYLGDIQ